MLVSERQEYLTSEEVARRLNVTHNAVKRWLRTKQMIGYQFGRQWRVRPDDFERFVRERHNLGDQPKVDPNTDEWPIMHVPSPEQQLGR